MGGFKLIGEKSVIYSTAPVVCYCVGYIGQVDGSTEENLVRKTPRILDPYTDLPVPQRGEFLSHHLPTDMSYAVRPREMSDNIKEPGTPTLNVSGPNVGWGAQFAEYHTVQ